MEKQPPTWVKGQDALALELDVSTRTLKNWFAREDLKPHLPRPKDNGHRHNVPAWRAVMLRFNLKRAGDSVPGDEFNCEGVLPKTHWDRLRAQIGFEREVFAFEADKLKHIDVAAISSAVGQMLAGFRTALNNLPSSAARWVIGLRDFHAIKDKLQSEVDAVLQSLGRCEYLENLIPEVVAKLYPNHDEAFHGNLIQCADGVLREFGRMALSDLLQRALPQAEPSAPASAAPAEADGENHDREACSESPGKAPAPSRSADTASPKHRAAPRSRKGGKRAPKMGNSAQKAPRIPNNSRRSPRK